MKGLLAQTPANRLFSPQHVFRRPGPSTSWRGECAGGVGHQEGHGFASMNEYTLKPSKPDPGEEWKKLEEELGPMHGHFMWRPAGGHYEEGKTIVPWERQV